jgi:methionyl aminopeptidase
VIVCRSESEIARLLAANQLVADVLAQVEAAVAEGVSTLDLDVMAERLVRAGGAEPAFKGYRGIPSRTRLLQKGDVLSVDMGVKLGGYYGDSAVTVAVGDVPQQTQELLRVTRESLDRAIEKVQVGGRLSDVSHAVQEWVEQHGFAIVREFVGHGIGEKLHEEPQIPNYGTPGRGPRLAAGMVLAIEPMVAMGRPETKVLADGWTAVTRDRSLAAHFEHTVAVTAAGPLVLSARKSPASAAAG